MALHVFSFGDPHKCLFNGYTRSSVSGIKRPRRDADSTRLSRAELKNKWKYTTTPSVRLRGV